MSQDARRMGQSARWERRLRWSLIGLGLESIALALWYLCAGIFDGTEYPFVANSVSKDGFFAALCAIALADVWRFGFCVTLVAVGHLLLAVGLVAAIVGGGTATVVHTLYQTPLGLDADVLAWLWLAAVLAIAAWVFFVHSRALRARLGLRHITHTEFVTLAAMAEVLIDAPDQNPTPRQVAHNVDEYFGEFRAVGALGLRVAVLALSVFPVALLHAPFPIMSPERRRRFVQRHMLDAGFERWWPGWLRNLLVAMARAAQQQCFIGYYGSPEGGRGVGYLPYTERPGTPHPVPIEHHPPLHCESPRDVGDELCADVVIVGTGAAGATLAYRLAEQGREVLLLERGRHIDPSQFSERESTQIATLYADGATTLSRDFRFAVLQGMCVGGSTVVNNAVCFDLPPDVLERWMDPRGLNAGLEAGVLGAAFTSIRELLPVRTIDPEKTRLNPGSGPVGVGVARLGYDREPWKYEPVDASIAPGCLGCGHCNIGCRYGHKLSALDNLLPRAQFEHGRQAVRILAECKAQAIEHCGGRASAVRCKLSDGRTVRVRANTVVVAGGAIASSLLLQASDLQRGRAGRGLAFNLGVPLTADFPDEQFPHGLHSERGLQMSHYLTPPPGAGYTLETWFNPVMMQSLFMPGWFHQHRANMLRYPYMTCVGSVAASHASATVRAGLFGRGVNLDYTPSREELTRLVAGLKLAARICFEGGATRAMPPTLRYLELRNGDDVDRLDELVESGDLSVNSAHPQGGNAISADRDRGVVDPEFRVWGTENVHVCDASVFPSAIGVNPQLTVMALAEYAAPLIAASR